MLCQFSKNINPAVPFSGAAGLLEWIYFVAIMNSFSPVG